MPRKFHGQRRLAGCSSRGSKGLDPSEHTHTGFFPVDASSFPALSHHNKKKSQTFTKCPLGGGRVKLPLAETHQFSPNALASSLHHAVPSSSVMLLFSVLSGVFQPCPPAPPPSLAAVPCKESCFHRHPTAPTPRLDFSATLLPSPAHHHHHHHPLSQVL